MSFSIKKEVQVLTILETISRWTNRKPKISTEDSYLKMNKTIMNRISPDSIEETETNIISGGNFTQTLVVVDFTSILAQEFIQNLQAVSENVSLISFIERLETAKVEEQLNTVMERSEDQMNSPYTKGIKKRKARDEGAAAGAIFDRTLSKGKKYFYYHLLIHCVASSNEELVNVISRVKAEAAGIGKSVYPRHRAMDAYQSILPLAENKVSELTYRQMSAKAVSYSFPFNDSDIFMPGGRIKGMNTKTKNVVKVDEEALLNKHTVRIGISGSGKSTDAFKEQCRDIQSGVKVRAIDPKRDYGPKHKRMGGEWLRFSLSKNGNRMNIFDIPKKAMLADDTKVAETDPLMDAIATGMIFSKLMFPLLLEPKYAVTKGKINLAIQKIYANKGIVSGGNFENLKPQDMPTLSDLDDLLYEWKKEDPDAYAYVKEFHQVLEQYVKDGTYAGLFDGHTNVQLDNDLIDFDISEVYKNEDVNKLIYFILLSHLRNDVINGDLRPTKIYIDEAHIIADPKVVMAMEYLFELMKIVRSFNCGVDISTQSLSDFLSAKDSMRNYGEAVIDQAVQMVLLPMKAKEVKLVDEMLVLNLNEDERAYLTLSEATKAEQAGKGFYYLGNRKVYYEVFLTDLEADMWFNNDYSKLEAA